MKSLKIASLESLDLAIAKIVQLRIARAQLSAGQDAAVARTLEAHQTRLTIKDEEIAALETLILDYCTAHRTTLFPERKSRETSLAEFGFELTPPRVEPASRKITWKKVVARLLRLGWGKAYVRRPDPVPDKRALVNDRAKFTPEQLTSAGIQFCQDEQFYIRPKPESAADSVQEAA